MRVPKEDKKNQRTRGLRKYQNNEEKTQKREDNKEECTED